MEKLKPFGWKVRDYAENWAKKGNHHYQAVVDFSDRHGISVSDSFALLGGTVNWSNIRETALSGQFKVKDQAWAESVAGTYMTLGAMKKSLRNSRVLSALMAVCRLKHFDRNRLLKNADRYRDKLYPAATRDGALEMLTDIYNRGQHRKVDLREEAVTEMDKRNPKGKIPKAAA